MTRVLNLFVTLGNTRVQHNNHSQDAVPKDQEASGSTVQPVLCSTVQSRVGKQASVWDKPEFCNLTQGSNTSNLALSFQEGYKLI